MVEQSEEQQEEQSRIHVDEEWKRAVQEEKARLREQEEGTRPRPGAGPAAGKGPLPEPSIPIFLAGLYTQTLVELGELENPASGKREQRLEEAEYLIDTISLLRDKMEGNLDDEEQAYVQNVLTDLRMRYVSAQGGGEAAESADEAAPEQ
ncbi:MAG: DUF1844 domain-containing protein [Candidatus Brocadiia bacterium]